jgi:hypothetical protein
MICEFCLQVYIEPISTKIAEGKLKVNAEDVKTVFSSSAVILNYSSQLIEELNQRISRWDSKTTKIGDVFLKMV